MSVSTVCAASVRGEIHDPDKVSRGEYGASALKRIRQVFLDMDGTIYHGNTLFPGTIPFLNFLKSRGIGCAFLTNNSSTSRERYLARLAAMGIELEPENLYTSTHYTIDYLRKYHPEYRRLYLLGVPEIAAEFEAAGFEVGFEAGDGKPQAVVVAFDRSLTYERLCRAAWFMHNGVPSFATHPDLYCQSDRPEWLIDCGAICACLEKSTGVKLKMLGKPDPGLLHNAAAARGITDMREVLMVGDRLATDIALGANAGSLTCHIADPDAKPESGVRPDYTMPSLAHLQEFWQLI